MKPAGGWCEHTPAQIIKPASGWCEDTRNKTRQGWCEDTPAQVIKPGGGWGGGVKTHLLRCLMSTCSITSTLPPPGASRTLMGLGTFTVFVFRMAVKLAISPSNILLACQKNTRGSGNRGRQGYFRKGSVDMFSSSITTSNQDYPD